MPSRLQQEITDSARVVPLDELQKSGTRFVRVIDPATLGRILGKAVTRALQKREVHLAGGEREEIERAARAEFSQLMSQHQKVLQEKSKADERREALERQVDDLRGELQLAEQRLAREREQLAGDHTRISPESLQDVELRVRGLLRRMLDQGDLAPGEGGAPPEQLQAFHDALGRTVERVVAEQRRRLADEQRGAREEEIELLERRIAKLHRALTERQEALDSDEGEVRPFARSASAYEPSKGISAEDPAYEVKKDMLEGMFRDNLSVQGGEEGGAPRSSGAGGEDADGEGA